ncbi:MAG: hypothetical protein ACLGIA_06860 [Actinomycetes bacterium]
MGTRLDTPGWRRAAMLTAGLAGAAIAYGVVLIMPVAALVLVLLLVAVLLFRKRKASAQFLLPFTVGFGGMLVLYGVMAVIAVVSSASNAASGAG